MIGKVSLGANIAGALAYGAGELDARKKAQKVKQVELLQTYNLGHSSWQGMAREMEAVAQGSPCQTPMWHTSLALKPEEQLSADGWRQAAHHYCQTIGADPERHQIAVYQHHDTAHSHIHIYINRVPIDQGPALSKRHDYNTSRYAVRRVEEQLGLSRADRLTSQHLPKHPKRALQAGAEFIWDAIAQTLQRDKPTNVDELVVALAGRGVQALIEQKKSGQWGTQFQYTVPGQRRTKVSGGDVGYKYNQLVAQLAANQLEQIPTKPVRKPATKRPKRSLAEQLAGHLDRLEQPRSGEPPASDPIARKLPGTAMEVAPQGLKPADSTQVPLSGIGIPSGPSTNSPRPATPVQPPKADAVPAGLKRIGGVLTTPAQQADLLAGKEVHLKGLLFNDGQHYDCVVKLDGHTRTLTALKEHDSQPAAPVAAPLKQAPIESPATDKAPPVASSPSASAVSPATQTAIAMFRASCRQHHGFDLTQEQIRALVASDQVSLPRLNMRIWVQGDKMAFESLSHAPKSAQDPKPSPAIASDSTLRGPVANVSGASITKPLPPTTSIKPPVVAPVEGPVGNNMAPPAEPNYFQAFRDQVKKKKSYLGAWDLQAHINKPGMKNELHLLLHREDGELFLTDEHNRTASFGQLGLDAKALGISALDIKNLKDLAGARKQGRGRSL